MGKTFRNFHIGHSHSLCGEQLETDPARDSSTQVSPLRLLSAPNLRRFLITLTKVDVSFLSCCPWHCRNRKIQAVRLLLRIFNHSFPNWWDEAISHDMKEKEQVQMNTQESNKWPVLSSITMRQIRSKFDNCNHRNFLAFG